MNTNMVELDGVIEFFCARCGQKQQDGNDLLYLLRNGVCPSCNIVGKPNQKKPETPDEK